MLYTQSTPLQSTDYEFNLYFQNVFNSESCDGGSHIVTLSIEVASVSPLMLRARFLRTDGATCG